jgi:hypothetical protein
MSPADTLQILHFAGAVSIGAAVAVSRWLRLLAGAFTFFGLAFLSALSH